MHISANRTTVGCQASFASMGEYKHGREFDLWASNRNYTCQWRLFLPGLQELGLLLSSLPGNSTGFTD
jgi:hypothetical protein